MYISKKNRKTIDAMREEGFNLSDNAMMKMIKETDKAVKALKTQQALDYILLNDPLGILG